MWTNDDVKRLHDWAASWPIDPRDVVKLMCHESGCNPAAHNPGGAVGLIQFEPDTLRSLGWTQGTDAFARLTVGQQLPFVERYFTWNRSAILAAGGGLGALYTATFLPARIPVSGDSTAILCASTGPLSWAYAANRVFDRDKNGHITVGDMVRAAEGAYAASAIGQDLVRRLDALDAVPELATEAALNLPTSGTSGQS